MWNDISSWLAPGERTCRSQAFCIMNLVYLEDQQEDSRNLGHDKVYPTLFEKKYVRFMADSQERECHSSVDIIFAGVFPREFDPNRPTFGTVEGDLLGVKPFSHWNGWNGRSDPQLDDFCSEKWLCTCTISMIPRPKWVSRETNVTGFVWMKKYSNKCTVCDEPTTNHPI